MELRQQLKLPPYYGEIVDKYLNVLEDNVYYDVYTIDDELRIVHCKGIIQNNGHYNYHNNYDNSENNLFVKLNNKVQSRWFTLNEKEAKEVQQKLIQEWLLVLNQEIERLKTL